MKTRQKIKWLLLGTFGLAALLFLTLVIHIAVMVYHKGPLPFEYIQMARADFIQPLDSNQVKQVSNNLKSQKGVKTIYYNPTESNIVYTFDNRKNTAQNIYNHAINQSQTAAKRYTVTSEDLKKGCPVMNSHSFYGKLTTVISKVVN